MGCAFLCCDWGSGTIPISPAECHALSARHPWDQRLEQHSRDVHFSRVTRACQDVEGTCDLCSHPLVVYEEARAVKERKI